jgi:hypothetical protein
MPASGAEGEQPHHQHEPAHHEPEYHLVVDGLASRFEGVLTRDDVAAAVDAARGEIEPAARVHDFLELLVERRALELLRAQSGQRGRRPEPA